MDGKKIAYAALNVMAQDDDGFTLFCSLRIKQNPDNYASFSCSVSHEQMQTLVNTWFSQLSPLQQQRAWASMKNSVVKEYPQGWRESDLSPDQVSEFIDKRRDQS